MSLTTIQQAKASIAAMQKENNQILQAAGKTWMSKIFPCATVATEAQKKLALSKLPQVDANNKRIAQLQKQFNLGSKFPTKTAVTVGTVATALGIAHKMDKLAPAFETLKGYTAPALNFAKGYTDQLPSIASLIEKGRTVPGLGRAINYISPAQSVFQKYAPGFVQSALSSYNSIMPTTESWLGLGANVAVPVLGTIVAYKAIQAAANCCFSRAQPPARLNAGANIDDEDL